MRTRSRSAATTSVTRFTSSVTGSCPPFSRSADDRPAQGAVGRKLSTRTVTARAIRLRPQAALGSLLGRVWAAPSPGDPEVDCQHSDTPQAMADVTRTFSASRSVRPPASSRSSATASASSSGSGHGASRSAARCRIAGRRKCGQPADVHRPRSSINRSPGTRTPQRKNSPSGDDSSPRTTLDTRTGKVYQ